MARANKASRKRDNDDEIGRRKVTTRESVAKAQANIAKQSKVLSGLSTSACASRPGQERAEMMRCRECGIEFETSDPLGTDICDGCYEALYEDDDDSAYDDAFADDNPFPEFDWMGEWLE